MQTAQQFPVNIAYFTKLRLKTVEDKRTVACLDSWQDNAALPRIVLHSFASRESLVDFRNGSL